MQPSAVFASATSRLHADVIVIRLTRAGLPASRISAVFPERLKPNCADCWLEGRKKSPSFGVEPIVAVGPLSASLDLSSEASLVQSLRAAGLGLEEAKSSVERLGKGQVLICAAVRSEEELSIAWHMFCELQADDISIATTIKPAPAAAWLKPQNRRRRQPARLLSRRAAVS
jgi:hypothetical protein